MNIISAIKNAFRYSIFDDLVDKGADKIERFPDEVLWLDKPNLIWIGDYVIENDALVGAKDDSVVIARRSGRHAVAIKIKDLKRDSDSIDRNRPLALRGLRVSFGERADRYVAERLITQAEQVGTGQSATRPEPKSEGGDKPQPEAEGGAPGSALPGLDVV